MGLSTTYTKTETDFLIQRLEEKTSNKYNDEANSIANDIIKLIDINTGENVNYREVTTWYDGTVMDDAKVDGVIFIKKGTKYYKRQFTNNIKTSWFNNIPALMFSIFNVEIDSDIDLGGATVNLKTKGELLFTKGSITNASIIGDNTAIINSSDRLIFKGVSISGTFICEKINWSWFGNYVTADASIESSDYLLLKAMFSLTFGNVGKCALTLENRIYDLYSKIGLTGDSGQGIFQYSNISDKEIKMNGATINDLRTFPELANQWGGVFTFINCDYITIKGGVYKNDNPFVDKETQMGYKGGTPIIIIGDSSFFDIDLEVYNARFGVSNGDFLRYEWNGVYGLRFSKIKIVGTDIGYPIVSNMADNLDLFVDVDGCHRACYLAGVSNLKAEVRCRNQYVTNVFFLLSDTRYIENGVVKYKAPFNIQASITDTGTTIAHNNLAYLAQFQTYPYFTGRTTPNIWNNINLDLKTESKSFATKTIGFNLTNNNETGNVINDVYTNININFSFNNNVDSSIPLSTSFLRVLTADNIVVQNFKISGNLHYYSTLNIGLNSTFTFENFKNDTILLAGKGSINLKNSNLVYLKPSTPTPSGNVNLYNTKGIVEVVKTTLSSYSNNYQIGQFRTNTAERPSANGNGGSTLFDISIATFGYSDNGVWRDYDKAAFGTRRSGTFAQKPTAGYIFIGFTYFCTDRKTTEAPSNGILIVHIGSDVWTDMLGRVVS